MPGRQDGKSRGEALQAAREQRFRDWFEHRRWRVMAEVTGRRESQDGAVFHYSGGFFVIDPPGVFQTPLGHKGRSGYMLREVGEDGSDLEGEPVAFGRRALEHAAREFGSVSGLPEKDPRIPPST